MGVKGGYGIAAAGRSEFGNAESVIEARFSASRPPDRSVNNRQDVWLRFTTYCYSSWIATDDILVEISENNGLTYNLAFDGVAFLPPYDVYLGNPSRSFRPDGQQIVFLFFKNGLWPTNQTVKIRFTGTDEFGQQATKETPVIWPNP